MPLIVEANGVDASEICRMSEQLVTNADFVGPRSANQSGQCICNQNTHVLRQYRAGPFAVPMALHYKELMLLEYIMDECLDKR